ncbi:hypothetical protein DH2020_005716 [Rehmannia glutinosa]|uniref:Membrane insertase YidC/Oxa/ALB C-terminal domain-containing protein n=1 Tax=Rehmannia glutinosa TaxID=99300 RepID=A0ABR0XGX0_REHGL
MAYRRSITARAKLFYQQQHRVAPSFSHIDRDDSDREDLCTNSISRSPEPCNYFQHRLLGSRNNFSTYHGSRNVFQGRRFAIPAGCGLVLGRNFSSGSVGEGAAEKIEILNDMVGVLGDKAVEVAPVANEVAVAAADSFFPVAALQYLIEYVHIYTGFDWWASIAVTTLLIRSCQLPLIVNQLKSTTKFTLLRPKLEAIKEEMQDRDMSPNAVAEGQARMKKLFKEYGVTPFTPLKGLLISAPIFCSFFFAVNNMAEKVPSFKEGGAFWFTDLTTPDTMYIFPVLTALTFWITVEFKFAALNTFIDDYRSDCLVLEISRLILDLVQFLSIFSFQCNAQEGLEGNPTAGTIKNVSRVFAALTIPFTASFPRHENQYFCAMEALMIKKPKVKKFFGIPSIPVPPPVTPSTDQKPGFSFFEALKKYAAAQQQQSLSSSAEASSKPTNQRIAPSSALNQRIKSLEKEVKGRKKGKKR